MPSRLSRPISLALRGRTVHIHSRAIGVAGRRRAAINAFVPRCTNVRGWSLRHMRSHRQRARGQLSSNARNTSLDALVDTLLDLLGNIATTGLLLLLSSGHLLNLLLTRHDLLAIHS